MTACHSLYAQQDAQYTQFLYNTQTYNPAFVGMTGNKVITALYRAQWIGVEGAPRTQSLYYSAPSRLKGLSVGFGLLNDKVGPSSETFFDLDVSYTVALSTKTNLAFGIKASANLLDINYSTLIQDLSQGSDPLLSNNIDNRFSPNIGAGVLFYNEDFFLGMSIPSFLETLHFDRSSLSEAKEKMHLYVSSGFVKELSPELLMRPSIIVKAVAGAPIQTDISTSFLLKEKISFGVSYRFKAALSGLIGYQFSEELFVGISYDKAATDLGRDIFNSGSTEIIFRYNFGKIAGMKTPRFMF